MREREMHERIQEFLKARMRAMVLPATLGVGLVALTACPSDDEEVAKDGGAKDTSAQVDTNLVTKYIAQLPDSGGAMPLYMAQMPDAMVAPEYMAQLPDAGGAVGKYMAQTPDAGVALRYMAQMPDAGGPVALYMALNPS